MREVFTEAVGAAIAPIKESVDGLRSDMSGMKTRLGKRIDATNENMSAQFAEQEKKIGKLIKEHGATS